MWNSSAQHSSGVKVRFWLGLQSSERFICTKGFTSKIVHSHGPGCWQEGSVPPCMNFSTGCLNVLMMRHLVSSTVSSPRGRARKEAPVFCDVGLDIAYRYLHHILLVRRQVIMLVYTERERNQAPPSEGRIVKEFFDIFLNHHSHHENSTIILDASPISAQLGQAEGEFRWGQDSRLGMFPSWVQRWGVWTRSHKVVQGETFLTCGHSVGEQLPWSCLKADQRFLPQSSQSCSLLLSDLFSPLPQDLIESILESLTGLRDGGEIFFRGDLSSCYDRVSPIFSWALALMRVKQGIKAEDHEFKGQQGIVKGSIITDLRNNWEWEAVWPTGQQVTDNFTLEEEKYMDLSGVIGH